TTALQDYPDDGAQGNDDADVTEDAAETAGDILDDFSAGQLIGEAGDKRGGQQCQEGKQFQACSGEHDEDDQPYQNKNQTHGQFPRCCFERNAAAPFKPTLQRCSQCRMAVHHFDPDAVPGALGKRTSTTGCWHCFLCRRPIRAIPRSTAPSLSTAEGADPVDSTPDHCVRRYAPVD